ncbi:MAG: T9SS type A sorting domain-containing protein [Ferruginibacter sp.]
MRTNFTFAIKALCFALISLFTGYVTSAQCVSPKLSFKNPTLSSGTALHEGATYKFTNVTSGVDAFIEVKKINNGAVLVCMDTTNMGYNDAWQPVINGPSAPLGNKSSVEFEIRFKTTSGSNYSYPCLDLAAIDVDGDNARIREFVESQDYSSYNTPPATLMSLLDNLLDILNPGKEAKGPVANRIDIDTTALDVRINFKYQNKDKIRVTLGAYVDNVTSGAFETKRYSSLYFKQVSNTIVTTLPVTYTSFNASVNNKTVLLNWATSHEFNSNRFEVERSFDKTSFTTLGLVLDAISSSGDDRNYMYKDNSVELQGKTIAYYRLKQVDIDGRYTYSAIIAVRLQAQGVAQMQVSPNPFAEKIYVRFTATENATAEIRITDLAGKIVLDKKVSVNKGYNNITADGLVSLGNGMYIAQLLIDGVVVDNQKIIKE